MSQSSFTEICMCIQISNEQAIGDSDDVGKKTQEEPDTTFYESQQA